MKHEVSWRVNIWQILVKMGTLWITNYSSSRNRDKIFYLRMQRKRSGEEERAKTCEAYQVYLSNLTCLIHDNSNWIKLKESFNLNIVPFSWRVQAWKKDCNQFFQHELHSFDLYEQFTEFLKKALHVWPKT